MNAKTTYETESTIINHNRMKSNASYKSLNDDAASSISGNINIGKIGGGGGTGSINNNDNLHLNEKNNYLNS